MDENGRRNTLVDDKRSNANRALLEWDRKSCVQNLAWEVKMWFCSSEFINLTVPKGFVGGFAVS